MKTFRRTIFLVALLVVIGSLILLLTNYTPFNPTYRRYSSETVVTTGDSNDIGLSGETVLSKDLSIPRNDDQNPQLVVCNTTPKQLPQKAKCIYNSDDIENYRVPDFVTDEIIAESKNAKRLLTSYERDYQQIQEIAIAAKALNRPFWLYVRHNTEVAPEYHTIVESTGGRVVYYFATDGYANFIDLFLTRMLAGGLGMIVIVLLWKMVAGYFTFSLPTIGQPKSSIVVSEHQTSRKARHSVDDYEQFMRNARNNARDTLDE
jgi:hypothetical protein